MRPSWFIDVDAQNFDFSDVEWFRKPDASEPDADNLKRLKLKDEIDALVQRLGPEQRDASSHQSLRKQSLRKLTKACRRLMNNAEENRDYLTANEFHYWSMEAQRKESWSRLGLIATLYWALSGYGERPWRALGVLAAMVAVFAVLFMWVGPPELLGYSVPGFWQAVVYSLATLSRLNPIPRPDEPGGFQLLVTAAGVLGPLQIALLALAVRRRVMR